MSAKYKSPSFLLPNELNTNTNPLNTDGNPATGTGINSLYSMNFDASSTQEISLGTISEISSGSDFSISLWFKAQHTGGYDTMYGSGTTAANDIYIAIDESKNIEIGVRGQRLIHVATNIVNNIWYHFVLTVEGTTYKAYLDNGTPATGSTGTNTANSGDNAVLGDFSWTGNFHFNGQMDEVAIFNRALNTTEIAALYDGTGSNIRPSNLMATNLGPLAYYPLGEQAQNSGYPGNTTPANNVWQFPNGVLQDYVMDFDGGNYIDVGENILPSGNFTISAWVKPDSFPIPYATIFSSYENSASGRLLFRIKNDGKLELSLDSATLTSNTSLSANTWQHVMVALSGTSLTFYLNGSSDGSGTASTPPAQNLTTYIGAWDNSGSPNGYFNGEISNLAIWNSDQATNKDNIYNNGSPQTSYTVTPQNWWKLNADSVYTPSAPNYTTSLDFNSTNTFVNVGALNNFITNNVTVSLWANFDTLPSGYDGNLLISAQGTSWDQGLGFVNTNPSGNIRFFIENWDNSPAGTGGFVDNTTTITINQWYHFCGTWDGSTVKYYINGDLQGSASYTGSITTTHNLLIGTAYNPANGIDGKISNTAIFNSALSSSQVSTLFNFGTPETNISFDPVAWWKLDDQTAITDSSGNGNTGTNNGAVNSPGGVAYAPSWKIPSALPITTTPNYTTALDFGGSDYIDCGNNSSLQFQAADSFSVSAWVNINSVTGNADFIVSNGLWNTSPYSGWGLNLQGANTLRFDLTDNNLANQLSIDSSGITLNTNTWYHVLFTYDGSNSATGMNFYLDGSLTSKTIVANNALGAITYTSSMKLNIGARESGIRPFNGDISNVSIFDSALTAPQVSTLYNGGTPETAISFLPVSWWKLDTGGSTITDYGSGGNNGTNNGPATQVTSDVLTTQPVNGVSTTLPSTALQQSDLQFDSPYSNYSLKFSTSQRVDTNFTLPASYTSYSYSIWYKQTAAIGSADQYLIGNWPQGGSSADMLGCVRFNGSVNLRFLTGNGTTLYQTADLNVSTLLLDGNWHHIAITIVSGEIKLYIDASLENTYSNASIVTGISANRDYALGFSGNTAGGGYLTNSLLDEFAIFNKKLTEAEILSIYNNGRPGDISPIAPTNWWRLGENAYFVNNNITLPNSIAGAPNGVSSGTATSMLTADAPGTYANGIGDGLAITDRVGDAPLSVANSQSYNMIPDDKVPYVPGYVGLQTTNAFEMTFNGVDSFFDTGNIDLGINSTLSMWFKPSTSPAVNDYALIGEGSNGFDYVVRRVSSNAFYVWVGGGGGNTGYANFGLTIASNIIVGSWNFLAIRKAGDTITVYLKNTNGEFNSTATLSLWATSSMTFDRIGSRTTSPPSSVFSGQIDEVAGFSEALTHDQIKFDLYEATTPGKTADIENNTNLPTPVAWYRMGD